MTTRDLLVDGLLVDGLFVDGLGPCPVAMEELGPNDAAVVLLIHGSGPGASAAGAWRLTLPGLAEHYRVIAPDLLGFGKSPAAPDGRHDRERWTAQLRAVLDAIDAPRVHLVGSSLGGGLALHLALQEPDRVDRLALISPLGSAFPITQGLERVWGYQPSLPAMDALMHTFVYDTSVISADIVQLRYDNSLLTQQAYSAMFPAPRQRWVDEYVVTSQQASRITRPTLIVHGCDDQVVPLSSSRALQAALPSADLLEITQCGHWAQIEHADQVNAAIIDFFDHKPEG